MSSKSTLKGIGGGLLGCLLAFAVFSLLWLAGHYIKRSAEDPLKKAVRNQDMQLVERLLKQGVNVDGDNHITPLHLASENGPKRIVELLIEHGADVNAKTAFDVTPLHFAAQGGDIEIANLLIAHGASVGAKDDEGRTPLLWIVGKEWTSQQMLELLELHEDALMIWQMVRSEEEYDVVVESLRYEQEFRNLKNKFRKRSEQEYQKYLTRLKNLR